MPFTISPDELPKERQLQILQELQKAVTLDRIQLTGALFSGSSITIWAQIQDPSA